MTTGQEWYKGKYKSLVGLLQENRRVTKEFQKKNKGFKVAIVSEFVIFAVFLLIFVGFGMRDFSRDTRNFVIILLIAIILIFALLDIFLWYMTIYKSKKDFIKKAKDGYPGVDLSSESSIKKYLWTFKDREFLLNLVPLIAWDVASRNAGGAVGPNSYTDTERVIRDVWTTYSIDRELYDYYFHGEHEISYLEGVVGSFSKIGAVGEAQIWAEAYHLFEKLEKIEDDTIAPEANDTNVCDDVNYYVYAINGIEGLARFACTEEERVWLTDLKQRHEELRENTEKLLYEYVMEHKDEFQY